MKKFASFLLILSLLLALAIPGFAFSAALSDQLLSVDGLTVNCEKYNVDGFNYFKLRDLAMALSGTESQFSVGYDEATDTVSIHSGAAYTAIGGELEIGDDKSVSACQSSQIITVNGSVVEGLSVYNIGGNNYFKLRDLADYIGFKVGYNESTRTALVTSARTHRVLSTEELYELCTPAVFKVETYDGLGNVLAWGSGFFLTESGLAVTNFHVISGASSAKVTLSATGDFDDAAAVRSVLGVYDYSEAEDWAVLQIEGTGYQTLNIAETEGAVGGAAVYAIGYPLALQKTFSPGIISNPNHKYGDMRYIQTTAAISSGSSGGALVNKYGEVLGITTATYSEGQNLNLALPMHYLEGFRSGSLTPLSNITYAEFGSLLFQGYEVDVPVMAESTELPISVYYEGSGTVKVEFSIGDPAVVTGGWSEWSGWDGDFNSINLILYPEGLGSTSVDIWLYTEDGIMLDSQTILVTVTAAVSENGPKGTLSLSSSAVETYLGRTYSVEIRAVPDDLSRNNYVSYYISDPSVVSCSWGVWEDSYSIPLSLTPLSVGRSQITIVYHTDDGYEMDSMTLDVTVHAG